MTTILPVCFDRCQSYNRRIIFCSHRKGHVMQSLELETVQKHHFEQLMEFSRKKTQSTDENGMFTEPKSIRKDKTTYMTEIQHDSLIRKVFFCLFIKCIEIYKLVCKANAVQYWDCIGNY